MKAFNLSPQTSIKNAEDTLVYKELRERGSSGSDLLLQSLILHQVSTVFGFPGGMVIDLYDRLKTYPEIEHILVSHEQGGTHAADAYARITGKPGVMIVTSGPGATNTITGIANAFMDGIPLVVFSGQVMSHLLGKDAFQESNIIGISRPITKHNYQVKCALDLPFIISEAFVIASSGKPGPVLIDIPKDIFQQKVQVDHLPIKQPLRPLLKNSFENHLLQKVNSMIQNAERPVFLIGGGVITANAAPDFYQLANALQIPVVTTMMGLGAFPGTHELSLGFAGMHGSWYANMALSECDVLIAIGTRFSDRVTGKIEGFAPYSKIIHIDIDDANIDKNIKSDLSIQADAQTIIRKLNEICKKPNTKRWLQQIQTWKLKNPLYYKPSSQCIKPQQVIQKINNLKSNKAIVTTDVGQHQMWTAQYCLFDFPRTFITSGGLGTMGFGLPAALGAKIANRKQQVICVCGDGGFKMTSFELATAVQLKLDIKVIILNNGYLGMVRQWQEFFYQNNYASTDLIANTPDFIKLAESYGAKGYRADNPDAVDFVLKKGMRKAKGPVVMEFLVSPCENVYPMVPAGKAINEMVTIS
jgi:acetolactate synthase I/II/III large subunit